MDVIWQVRLVIKGGIIGANEIYVWPFNGSNNYKSKMSSVLTKLSLNSKMYETIHNNHHMKVIDIQQLCANGKHLIRDSSGDSYVY